MNCYLDGVPIKIGEKYKPPRRITLPLNYQHRDIKGLIEEEYDFHLERHVLELSESYRKKKEEKARAREDKVASQIEQFSRQPIAASDGSYSTNSPLSDESPSSSSVLPSSSGDSINDPIPTTSPQNDVNEQPSVNNAIMANMEGNILKPVPSDSFTVAPSQTHLQSRIKLEDFEAESSPFDSMELKTLNDMEELKSVLQGMSSSATESTTQGYSTTHPATSTGNEVTLESKPAVNGVMYYYPCAQSEANSVVSNVPEFTMSVSSSGYPCMYKNMNATSDANTADVSNDVYANTLANQLSYDSTGQHNTSYASSPCAVSWRMPFVANYNSYATRDNLKTDIAPLENQVSDFGVLTSTYFSSDSPFSAHQSTATTPGSDSSIGSGGLRSARSTPDLLKELGKTRKEEKRSSSAVRPPRPNSVGSVEVPHVGMEISDIHSSYEQKKKQFFNRLAYSEMNELERSLVQKLVDMGFPQDRTARAVTKFGTDDKKIIDHLCAMQSLVEKGFNPEKSELALFLYEDDEEVAKYFLQLLKQFLDLGFEEEAIKKALYLCKNDRDKALDYLVS